jgi:hypothetical protein
LQLQTAAKTAGINHEEWLANADSWVAGFLEKFEQHCHNMVVLLAEGVTVLCLYGFFFCLKLIELLHSGICHQGPDSREAGEAAKKGIEWGSCATTGGSLI